MQGNNPSCGISGEARLCDALVSVMHVSLRAKQSGTL